ncbi:LBP_cg2779 family protein [Limosilactobacillus difficilis]|uniref:LBP_cg2779 family protein n=1 Tax=Limosilactobacillus difficilis TaxID=2991838 RepID=UPI0024BBDD2A|nr:LBP_cg2779 family protein [Limosilactobacillus difficilis]
MADKENELAHQIIEFERKKEMTDNEVALGSQLSVERVHDIKSEATEPTIEEIGLLQRFMQSKGDVD